MKTLRIGITGLHGAGKTVFMTSLINRLLEGSETPLDALKDAGVSAVDAEQLQLKLKGGKVHVEEFPYLGYLNGFRKTPPSWPDPTDAVTKFRIALTLSRKGKLRNFNVELLDYPGERLLDLPLLKMGYRQWSKKAVGDEKSPGQALLIGREAFSREWVSLCRQIPNAGEDLASAIDATITAYRAYLRRCHEAKLPYSQPSAMVSDAACRAYLNHCHKRNMIDDSEDAQIQKVGFCPLPPDVIDDAPAVAKEFEARYRAYRKGYVKPFAKLVTSCSKQVVLVDVLGVLRRDVDCYNETRACVEDILRCFNHGKGKLRILRPRPVRNVYFVATKADQCTKRTRANLKDLLAIMVCKIHSKLKAKLPLGQIGFGFCSAHDCTTDTAVEENGREVPCLKGSVLDRPPGELRVWQPGEVPSEWPKGRWDSEKRGWYFHDCHPQPFPARDGAVIPHINLDRVFWDVIKDELL